MQGRWRRFWPVAIVLAAVGVVVSLYEVAPRSSAPRRSAEPVVVDRFAFAGISMAFVVTELSPGTLRTAGVTIMPMFKNDGAYPVSVQFDSLDMTLNGVEAPRSDLTQTTPTFAPGAEASGWHGNPVGLTLERGDVVRGTIKARLRYFNRQHGFERPMIISGRVIARLPKRGRIVAVEWRPDAGSRPATRQADFALKALGPTQTPLGDEDRAILARTAPPTN